ncbi:hypothetical protein [Massilia niastensis]|uniref:hypothetical protein n=1 Tax=Massilia niastensis TaxID=544911 RepID=UPI00037D61FF|nr:hypothetical protein [Massilia niastensis]
MSLLRRSAATLLLPAVLAGCAATLDNAAPARRQVALLNQRGVELHRNGDPAAAARLFEQAVRAAQAIEHEDGIAQGLLNLARARLQQDMPDAADAALDRLLAPSALAFPAARRAEALLHKTNLALQRRDLDAAARWHGQALAACACACAQGPALLNLGARIALERDDPEAALRDARAALARHRSDGNLVEAANALRLAGAAQLARHGRDGRAAALPELAEALELDKRLALSDKIVQDLVLLGHASDAGARRAWWLRARDVAQAAGKTRLLADIDTLLAAPSAPPEPPRNPE